MLLLSLLAVLASGPLDTLVHGGTIYTLRGDRPSPVEALGIVDGEIVHAGSLAAAQALADANTERIDLAGAVAVPGLADAHAHLFNLGRTLAQADLRGTTSEAECLRRLQEFAATLGPGEWLLGRSWDQNDWPVTEYPTRHNLDDLFPDRPVYLRRVDGHAGWVNSAALAVAGWDATTPDPEGGELIRSADGELTGILIDAADDALRALVPEETPDQLDRIIARGVANAAAHGLTSVHEMGIDNQELAALERAEAAGELPLRVVVYLGGHDALQNYEGGPVRPDASRRLRVEGVKLYADGALGSRGAALLEDYSDRPGHQGLLIVSPQTLQHHVEATLDRDLAVAIHAIGDRGNRVALDAIEHGYGAVGQRRDLAPLPELRARVEHVQVLAPDDIPRFSALGVIPSMQPTHCTSDMPWAPDRVGPDRIQGAYAWQTLLNLGSTLPLGSDFPVEKVSPLLGLYAAQSRRTPDGEPEEGWSVDQALTALQALLGFTVWPAAAAGVPQWGRLADGYRADLTVLDVDPLEASPSALLGATVAWTMVDGQIYGR